MAASRIDVAFPFSVDVRGRTAVAGYDDHIRDLIEQVLFTTPGERVNRPDFGAGLLQLVFRPSGDELAAATQMMVQGSLQRWLGQLIAVQDVAVDWDPESTTLAVTVRYTVLATREQRVDRFTP
jgi:phage baseplate assembly protein W